MAHRWLLGLALCATVASPGLAQDDRDGQLETTAELLTACAPAADNPEAGLYRAFCHGYIVGVYHFSEALARGPDPVSLVCVPEPRPDVTSATAAFVAWAQANPQYAEEPPVESVMRWAMTTYPCP